MRRYRLSGPDGVAMYFAVASTRIASPTAVVNKDDLPDHSSTASSRGTDEVSLRVRRRSLEVARRPVGYWGLIRERLSG
ncbi:unnamed protein product [Ectocarpus sp. 12 AP-2014]